MCWLVSCLLFSVQRLYYFRQMDRLQRFYIVFQVFDDFNVIVVEVQFSQIYQVLQIFDFGQSVVL